MVAAIASTGLRALWTGVITICAAVACGAGPRTETAAVHEARAQPHVDVAHPAGVDARPEPAIESAADAAEIVPPLPELPIGARLVGDEVRVDALVAALEAIAVGLQDAPALHDDYAAWTEAHGLTPSDRLWRDWVCVRLVFECVRDGGLWQLRWAITNREPRSDEIWSQWTKHTAVLPDVATATAECDELSALFAVLVRRLGVQDVGLFWPQWNHVVAVWTIDGVRIVVPTSQIFLDDDASLGTTQFDPWKQKTIYEYRRKDVRDDATLPGDLARFFVERAWTELRRPQSELQQARNARSAVLGGS